METGIPRSGAGNVSPTGDFLHQRRKSPKTPLRRHKLHIPRRNVYTAARSFRCASFSHCKHSVGLQWEPCSMVSRLPSRAIPPCYRLPIPHDHGSTPIIVSNMILFCSLFAAALWRNGRSHCPNIFGQSAADERTEEQRPFHISGPLLSLTLRVVKTSTTAKVRSAPRKFLET